MGWQALALALAIGGALVALAWSWRGQLRLELVERDLAQLREAAVRSEVGQPPPAVPPQPAPPMPPSAGAETLETVLDEIDRRRHVFATLLATQIVPQRRHRASEPFVLVVEVVLMNAGERDVRLSLRTRENEAPLAVQRYLGQPEKPYSAPHPVPASVAVESERGSRAQIVRAGGVETLDFAVPLHEAGLYRVAFRVRGDEIIPDEAKGGGGTAVVWSRHKHVVVG